MKFALALSTVIVLVACGRSGSPDHGAEPRSSTPGLSQPAPAMETGTVNGGGGVGVRCGRRLEMLDIFEARRAGLRMAVAPVSSDEAAALVAERIATHFWNFETILHDQHVKMLRHEIVEPLFEGRPIHNVVKNTYETVNSVAHLPLSNDFGKYVIPAGCALEQIAYYSDDVAQVSIVKSAWDELDWLSKSVLVAHELIYMIERREGLHALGPANARQTSESSRKFVGRLLSTNPPTPKSANIPQKESLLTCGTDAEKTDLTYGYAFNRTTTGKLSWVLNVIRDHASLYQTRANFKTVTADQLLDPAAVIDPETTSLETVDSGEAPQFSLELKKTQGGPIRLQLRSLVDGKKIGASQEIHCHRF